ncbi:MAG: HpaII family restriction endonuclease [Eubacteriales bacterium]|nr:HpaII family restriction endonuclease [Eubacteriales bacterium]
MLTGNIGEWSEMYTFLRLLADGRIYAADENLNKLKHIFFPIVKILREEVKGHPKEYKTGEYVEIFVEGQQICNIPAGRFDREASHLLTQLRKSGKGTLSFSKTEKFMDEIGCKKISASSTEKSDITLQILDINTRYSPVVGFSIKSDLGSKPTLLNASKATNFIFRVDKNDQFKIEEYNNIYSIVGGREHTDVAGRIRKVYEDGCKLTYVGMESSVFSNNLVLLDSRMDEIIAETLIYRYKDGIVSCKELVDKLQTVNPMGFTNEHAYVYKFKKLLAAAALGMRPATIWDGLDEATGGYIIVTKEGNVLAYHIYNRNFFENYLLLNTKYETPSTTRHQYGNFYKEDDKAFIKLNLQIRFK